MGDRVKQLIADRVGIEIVQANPVKIQLAQLTQQLRQLPLLIQIHTVARNVLGDDDTFLHALIRQRLGLRQHFLHRTAAVFAAQGRDHAVGAAIAAALGNAQIRIVHRCGQNAGQFLHRAVDVGKMAAGLALHHLIDRLHDPAVIGGAHDAVHLGQLGHDLLTVALAQAAGHQNPAHQPRFFQRAHLQDVVDGFAFGAVDKTAGVDDHHIRPLGIALQRHARVHTQRHHLLRIHPVLVAAQ